MVPRNLKGELLMSRKTLYTIIAILLLLFGNIALYKMWKKSKGDAERWKNNYTSATSNAHELRKRVNSNGDTITKLRQFYFEVKELKQDKKLLSAELQKAREIAGDFEVKYKHIKRLYDIKVEASGTLVDTVIEYIVIQDSIQTIQFNFQDSLLTAKVVYLLDSKESVLNYTVFPEIRGIAYKHKNCNGSWFVPKIWCKWFKKAKYVKIEFDCKQENCNVDDGFIIEVSK